MAKLDMSVVTIVAERNTPAEMRDGTVLRADVYRTDGTDSHPVPLIRNPYGEPMVRTAPVLPAVEWCARQPWCDGTVAMYGPSYLGMAQFADLA